MRSVWIVAALLLAHPALAAAQDAASVVAAAVRATGSETLTTLVLNGAGTVGTLGQNVRPDQPWPLTRLVRYTRRLDLGGPAASFESVRLQNNRETPQSQVTPAGSPWARQVDVWVATPYAFLRQAAQAGASARTETVDGVGYTVVRVMVDGKYAVDGFISSENLVERIRTIVDNDVLGDMPVEAIFRDYKAFNGVKIPTLTIVKQGGYPTLIAGVTDATVNAAVSIAPPPAAAPSPAPVTVDAQLVSKGVYYLKGGSHHSVLVEFADHVTLIEAPQHEARSAALLQAIAKLYPKKPLTQVVNTHHHFDHSGGLRTFVDAGATIVTSEINRPFFEAAFAAPRTLNADRLQRSQKRATLKTVGDRLVLEDATRKLELYTLKDNPHNEGMLVALLPAEKILVQVDLYTPPAPDAAAPRTEAPVNPNTVALLTALEKLRLDFDAILPLHGTASATRADLYAAANKPLVPVAALPDPDAPTPGPDGRLRGTALPQPPATPNP